MSDETSIAGEADHCSESEAEASTLLTLLSEAARTLIGALGPEKETLPAILSVARRLIAADAYAVWRLSADKRCWNAVASAGLSESLRRGSIAVAGNAFAALPSEPIAIEDVEAPNALLDERRSLYRTNGIRSLLFVPMRIHNENSGIVTFYFRQPRRFREADIRLAGALSGLAASVLRTAELYQEQARARDRAALLAKTGAALSDAGLDMDATLDAIAYLAVPQVADWCAVFLQRERNADADKEGVPAELYIEPVTIAHADAEKAAQALKMYRRIQIRADAPHGAGAVIRTGQTEYLPDIPDQALVAIAQDEAHLHWLRETTPYSSLIVPLTARGRTFGALALITGRESGRRFTPADRAMAEEMARLAALAVDNARLYTDALRTSEEMHYLTNHARCLLWHGTVTDFHHPQFFEWRTDVIDPAAAQAFLPLDIAPGEHYTDAWYRARLPEGKQLADTVSRDALRNGLSEYQTEFGCQSRTGEVRWFSERVHVAPLPPTPGGRQRWRVVGVAVDITDRRHVDQELLRRERDYAALVDNAPDVLARFDRQLRFLYINEQATRDMGIPRSAFLGRTPHEIAVLPAENLPVWENGLRHVFATGEPTRIEFGLPTALGERWFESVITPEFNEQNQVETVVTISRDITDRQAVERAQQTVIAQQRLFLREMLYSLTEGRLRLCDSVADLPSPLTPFPEGKIDLSQPTLHTLRKRMIAAAKEAGLSLERAQDMETAVGEAGMNAVLHGGGGIGEIRSDDIRGTVQVWVQDTGSGIPAEALHRATLERGWTTAGTLGHGFWLMLKTCDRVYLLTGAAGTTVVLEQDRTPPAPAWL